MQPGSYIDARTDAIDEPVEGSVCVIGAGAAGLTLVRRLARKVPGVVLIESGGFELDGDTQSLYASRMRGLAYFDLLTTRLRYFGGTTNHWSGYCRAVEAIDFESRPSVGLPGWPLEFAELKPFIVEAAGELGILDPFLGPPALLEALGIESDGLVERSSRIFRSKILQIAKEENIRLGPRYRDEIGAIANVKTYLNLNAVHIELAADGASVDHVRCATLSGKQITVKARFFVLCCHAVENARLLLTSNNIEGSGIGNRFDHVGRYFMDHILVPASKFIPSDAFPRIYNYDFAVAHSIFAYLGFVDRVVREKGVLQYANRFVPVYADPETAAAYDRVHNDFLEPGDISFLQDVATLATDLSAVSRYAAARRKLYFAKPLYYRVEHHLEQGPNPDSRLVISDRRDALGSLIADLDWQLGEPDFRSLRIGQQMLEMELATLGWGRLMPEPITPEFVRSQATGLWHNIGTTRMSATPSAGVVDPDCRVHGVANLYIGGSSIFPSAGAFSPTMMIIALASRLSEHLKHQLDSFSRIVATPG